MGMVEGLEALVGLIIFIVLLVGVGMSFLKNLSLESNIVFWGIGILAVIVIAAGVYFGFVGGDEPRKPDMVVEVRHKRA